MAPPQTKKSKRQKPENDVSFWVASEIMKKPSKYISDAVIKKFTKKNSICYPEYASCLNITPCLPGEACCTKRTDSNNPHFTYFFDTLFSVQSLKLPFSDFICNILTLLNIAPTQLHPNSWAFIKCFESLCYHFNIIPTYSKFFYFFERNTSKTIKSDRVFLVTASGRGIMTKFRNNYKHWKKRIF